MAALGSISAGIWQHGDVFIFLLSITDGFYTASSRQLDNFLSDSISHAPHFSHCLIKMQLTYLSTGITEITGLRMSRQG